MSDCIQNSRNSQNREISPENRKILVPVVMIVLAILSVISIVYGSIISSLPIGVSGAGVWILSVISLCYYRHHLKYLFSKNSIPRSKINQSALPSTMSNSSSTMNSGSSASTSGGSTAVVGSTSASNAGSGGSSASTSGGSTAVVGSSSASNAGSTTTVLVGVMTPIVMKVSSPPLTIHIKDRKRAIFSFASADDRTTWLSLYKDAIEARNFNIDLNITARGDRFLLEFQNPQNLSSSQIDIAEMLKCMGFKNNEKGVQIRRTYWGSGDKIQRSIPESDCYSGPDDWVQHDERQARLFDQWSRDFLPRSQSLSASPSSGSAAITGGSSASPASGSAAITGGSSASPSSGSAAITGVSSASIPGTSTARIGGSSASPSSSSAAITGVSPASIPGSSSARIGGLSASPSSGSAVVTGGSSASIPGTSTARVEGTSASTSGSSTATVVGASSALMSDVSTATGKREISSKMLEKIVQLACQYGTSIEINTIVKNIDKMNPSPTLVITSKSLPDILVALFGNDKVFINSKGILGRFGKSKKSYDAALKIICSVVTKYISEEEFYSAIAKRKDGPIILSNITKAYLNSSL